MTRQFEPVTISGEIDFPVWPVTQCSTISCTYVRIIAQKRRPYITSVFLQYCTRENCAKCKL